MNLKKSYWRLKYRMNPVKELKKLGLTVGKNFDMLQGVFIDLGHTKYITIGDDVTLAPRVMIITHDASTAKFMNVTKFAKTTIGNKVFIGAGSKILPDVQIGNNVIIGAGSVVTKDIPSNVVCCGNPAKIITTLDNFLRKRKKEIENSPQFPRKEISNKPREIDRIGYVVG